MIENNEIDCPSCGGFWYEDLDEDGKPYTCFRCCNGTMKLFAEDLENDGQPDEAQEWHDYDPDC